MSSKTIKTDFTAHSESRLVLYLSIGLTLLCAILYGITLNPTLNGGDSGELITVAYTWGVAHPPGYPLFTILGKILTLIPIGSIALRVNTLSALADTGAAVLLFLAVSRWSRNLWAGLLSGALAAFCPLIWGYAVSAEVFALNNFFVALLFYLAARTVGVPQPSKNLFYAACFAFGLGLTNHHTLLFVGIPILIWLWLIPFREMKKVLLIKKGLPYFLFGLLPYLYLPLAALRKPWNSWGNAATFEGFIRHLLRADYGTFQLASSAGPGIMSFWEINFHFVKNLSSQFTLLGVLVGVLGLYFMIRKEGIKGLSGLLACILLLYLSFFHARSNLQSRDLEILTRFWQLPYLIFATWIGLGFDFLTAKRGFRFSPAAALVLISGQIALNLPTRLEAKTTAFHRFAEAILAALPQDAILFSRGDIYSGTVWYLQGCEKARPDVHLVDRELLTQTWMKPLVQLHYPEVHLPGDIYHPDLPNGYGLRQLIAANISRFPVFFTEFHPAEDLSWEDTFEIWPHGFLLRIIPKGSPFSLESYLKETDRLYLDFDFSDLKNLPTGSWEFYIYHEYLQSLLRRTGKALDYLQANGNDPNQLASMAAFLEPFLAKQLPSECSELYKALGLIYQRLSSVNPLYIAPMKAALKVYLTTAPPGDKDFATISKMVTQ